MSDPNTVAELEVLLRSSGGFKEAWLEKLRADARVLWSVRVLDAWQVDNPDEAAFATYIAAHADWRCASHSYYRPFDGPTPDAARTAAALAVYPTLPADVRAELGECP